MEKDVAELIYSQKKEYARGKRGLVSVSEYRGKKFVIKEKLLSSAGVGTIKNEFLYNKKVNEFGIGPRIFYYDEEKDFLIREFVDGVKIEEWVADKRNSSFFKTEFKEILLSILNQARLLDLNGINKYELTNPHKDILITNKGPVIIDFERCRHTNKPKNVTQFLQYLTRPVMSGFLDEASIVFKKETAVLLGEEYKKDLSGEVYEKIKKVIKN